jgi:ribonuclease Z
MGSCPRAALASKFVAVTHGHMDHVGGLPYYCSQRRFQGMGTGTIICDERVAPAMKRMMAGFNDLEQQVTPYELIPMRAEQEIEIKNQVVLRAFPTEHTVPSLGYVVIEKRSKLRDEYVGYPQEKLRELKSRGVEITRILDIPLVAYLGDTAPGEAMLREDVRKAQIVISECTFIEEDHRERAVTGKHLHLDNIIEWLPLLECDMLVLTHLSRRSNIGQAKRTLQQRTRPEDAARVGFLMDHRHNRERYNVQLAEAEAKAQDAPAESGTD